MKIFPPNELWYYFRARHVSAMEYLVTMAMCIPEATPDEAVEDIRGRETARFRELAA